MCDSCVHVFRLHVGGGHTHYAIMKGSNANLIVRQGKEQGYKPALFVEPADPSTKTS